MCAEGLRYIMFGAVGKRLILLALRILIVLIPTTTVVLVVPPCRDTAIGAALFLYIYKSADHHPLCPTFASAQAIYTGLIGGKACVGRMLARMRQVDSDSDARELWETPYGRFWIPRGNARILADELCELDHDPRSRRGEKAAKPGDTVLDCGANLGTYTREVLSAGARLVIAIEPSPDPLGCLRKTLAQEVNAGRVVVYPKGVWDREEVRTMRLAGEGTGGDTLVRSLPFVRGTADVPLTTIDALVNELGLHRVDVIKMDIEGAERRALIGARRAIARFRPRLAISGYHLPDDSDVIRQIVASIWPDYRLYCTGCRLIENRVAPVTLLFY